MRRTQAFVCPSADGTELQHGRVRRAAGGARALLRDRRVGEELALDARLRSLGAPSRPNLIAVGSPRGGVGKTTMAFALGDLLAQAGGLRVVVLDADPGFGTLGSLVPDRLRSPATPGDLLAGIDHVHSAADLGAFVSRMPSGLDVLGAPPGCAGGVDPARLGELLAFLGHHYELVIADLPAGVGGEVQELALARADQAVVLAAGDWAGGASVLGALKRLEHPRLSVVLNRARGGGEPRLAAATRPDPAGPSAQRRLLTVPEDPQLAAALDSGTYALGALAGASRLQIKRLGLAVREQLV